MNQEQILNALKQIRYPGFSRDIVSFGLVRDVRIEGGQVTVLLAITTADSSIPGKLNDACKEALLAVPGVTEAVVNISLQSPKGAPTISEPEKDQEKPLAKVRAVVAVASGKGGVGKSSVAVNIACAMDKILSESGRTGRIGILDCDIYGPSVPLMMGTNARPQILNGKILPETARGLKLMSMGLLLDDDSPVVWRGPMVTNAIGQFLRDVDWGELDVLVVDMPPGTGDAQLALVQTIPVTGAVIVTTPQNAAVTVARRGGRMFEKVNVPILGIVENMSYLLMPNGEKNCIFGSGGGEETAKSLDTRLIAEIPLDTEIRAGCDAGMPSVLSNPESEASKAFRKAAESILDNLNIR